MLYDAWCTRKKGRKENGKMVALSGNSYSRKGDAAVLLPHLKDAQYITTHLNIILCSEIVVYQLILIINVESFLNVSNSIFLSKFHAQKNLLRC